MKIAFDFDGTLVSCKQKQMNCLRYNLSRCNIDADLDRIWDEKKTGSNTYDSLIKCGVDPIVSMTVCMNWQECIEEPFWGKFDSLFSGALNVLSKFQKQGVLLFLITARNRPEWVGPQLIRLGISEFFQEVRIVSPSATTLEKAAALAELGIDFYFGDSELDFLAAQKSNVKFIGLSSGQRSREFLLSKGVKTILSNLSEIDFFRTTTTKHEY